MIAIEFETVMLMPGDRVLHLVLKVFIFTVPRVVAVEPRKVKSVR